MRTQAAGTGVKSVWVLCRNEESYSIFAASARRRGKRGRYRWFMTDLGESVEETRWFMTDLGESVEEFLALPLAPFQKNKAGRPTSFAQSPTRVACKREVARPGFAVAGCRPAQTDYVVVVPSPVRIFDEVHRNQRLRL